MSAQDAVRAAGAADDDRRRGLRRIDLRRLSRVALLGTGNGNRLPDAIAEYEAALRIRPDSAAAHNNLGYALSQLPGRLPDAVAEYRAALRIDPSSAEARHNLEDALRRLAARH